MDKFVISFFSILFHSSYPFQKTTLFLIIRSIPINLLFIMKEEHHSLLPTPQKQSVSTIDLFMCFCNFYIDHSCFPCSDFFDSILTFQSSINFAFRSFHIFQRFKCKRKKRLGARIITNNSL